MNYTIILALMGGLGLFLYGMKLMSDGLEKAAGAKLRRILETKKRHNVRLLCAIPHEHQSDRYPPDWKKRYNVCLVHSDGVHIFAPQYFTGCFAVRNRFMVDASSLLLCYYDGRSGGTAQTVFYAEKQHVRTVNLAKSAFSL